MNLETRSPPPRDSAAEALGTFYRNTERPSDNPPETLWQLNTGPLWREFGKAVRAMKEKHYDQLAAAGVPDLGFIRGGPGARVGILRGENSGPFWQPSPHGRPIIIIADGWMHWPNGDARPPGWAEIAELVAIDETDTAWWLRRGDWPILGWHQLEGARERGAPIRLHAHPRDWLKAAGKGCVVLNWNADLRGLFDGARVQADPRLAATFNERLRRALPALPEAEVLDE